MRWEWLSISGNLALAQFEQGRFAVASFWGNLPISLQLQTRPLDVVKG
jgi:hypothetical protein